VGVLVAVRASGHEPRRLSGKGRAAPAGPCLEISFGTSYRVGEGGQVALEDYARALSRAEGAEAILSPGDPERLAGLHLCGPAVPLEQALLEEIAAFARQMAHRTGPGLGWS
jgi:hypothetical protein